MPTFCKIFDEHHRIQHPYVLKIESFTDIMCWHMSRNSEIAKDVRDLMLSKEVGRDGDHCRSWMSSLPFVMAAAGNPGASLHEVCDKVMDMLLASKFEILSKVNHFYINRNGGVHVGGYSESDNVHSDVYVFPDNDDIRVFKWSGGNHWYAKIGNEDVVVDGEQKWKTKSAAINAASMFKKHLS